MDAPQPKPMRGGKKDFKLHVVRPNVAETAANLRLQDLRFLGKLDALGARHSGRADAPAAQGRPAVES